MQLTAPTARIDFHKVFDRLPTPFMMLDRDLTYVEVNAAYLAVTERTRDSVIGRNIFDAFPEQGESRRLLEESLFRVRDTGREDLLPLIKYDIPRPESQGGGFYQRYWSCTHTPVLNEAGRVEFIIQHTQDITELQLMRQRAEDLALEQNILRRAATVQAQGEELQRLFDSAPGFMAIIRGPEMTFEWANRAYYRLIGHREIIGRTVADAVPEARQAYVAILQRVFDTAQPFIGRAMALTLPDADGRPQTHYLDFIYQPVVDADGTVSAIMVEGQDVTEAFLAQEKQQLLLDELNHRVKNTLAAVQAIVAQTLRSGRPLEDFSQDLQARLKALSHTHDTLTGAHWRGAPLRAMLEAELAPFAEDQVRLAGENLVLPPTTALPLGMVFHELSTNAAKHGALSRAAGSVSVDWVVHQTDNGSVLEIAWIERGGPAAVEPARRGFGARLIERTLAGELNGSAQLDYQAGGLRCTLKVSLKDPAQ